MFPIAPATVRFGELSALWGADCICVSSTRTSADSVVDKLLVTSGNFLVALEQAPRWWKKKKKNWRAKRAQL